MRLSEDTLPDAPRPDEPPAPEPVTASTPALDWSASSLVGLKRQTNEDRYGHEGALFAVADGMGGRKGGAEAAERAILLGLKYGNILGPGASVEEWRGLVRIVNMKVRAAMSEQGLAKAGCALTMASVEAGRVVAAHVGDTRLYEFDRGALHQRTRDHDLRNELTALGSDLEQAATEGLPLSGLTSFVGQPDATLQIEAFEWCPAPGARLLLCSDGVHRYVEHDAIAAVMSECPPSEAAAELTRQADAAGGRDNATAVVVQL